MKLFFSDAPARTRYELITMKTFGFDGIAGLLRAKEKGITKEVIADSGAYALLNTLKTSKRELHRYALKYAEWAKKMLALGVIDHYVELDVDNILTLEEIEKIREILTAETGKEPIVVWHTTRGISYFYEMLDKYEYVGLPKWSNIVDKRFQVINGRKVDMLAVYRRFVEDAKTKGVKVHLFGTGLSYDALALKPYSCDISAGRYRAFGGIVDATFNIHIPHIFGAKKLTLSFDANRIEKDYIEQLIKLQESFEKIE